MIRRHVISMLLLTHHVCIEKSQGQQHCTEFPTVIIIVYASESGCIYVKLPTYSIYFVALISAFTKVVAASISYFSFRLCSKTREHT